MRVTPSIREHIESSLRHEKIRRAFQMFEERENEIEADQIRVTQVPAPPFKEEARSRFFAEQLRLIGFDPTVDGLGNVIVRYGEEGPNALILGAHLDTVFPEDVPLKLRRVGRVVHLPGVADNGAGLIALLWTMRVAKETGLRFRRPVWAVANVGEEGQGNLRGIRHLFETRPWGSGQCEFIALDGAGIRSVTHQGLGSRRFQISLSGPGGHSWADFGCPNPIHAVAAAIHRFVSMEVHPGTSFNIGTIHGGLGVNSIAKEVTIQVDVRSTSVSGLQRLTAGLEDALRGETEPGLDLKIQSLGERPLGETALAEPLVQTAIEATRIVGVEPQPGIGSTDANLAMSLGAPAIALGAGGSAGNIHTPQEWFDPSNRADGLRRLLLVVAARAGLV